MNDDDDGGVDEEEEKTSLLRAIENLTSVREKAKWAMKWIESDTSFAHRLIAFAAVEGIFFSGSFCAIFWLKHRGMGMPGLTFSNELISRDEAMHTDFAIMLYRDHLLNKLTTQEVRDIIEGAVEIEKQFVCESLPVSLIGMNSDSMSTYIEFVADRLMTDLGYEKIYNARNPFPWMEMLGLEGKTNFFERKVSEYAKAGVSTGNNDLTWDEDF